MAKLYGEIASSALMTFDKSFARANGQPLDSTEIYYSYESAQEYAAGAGAYIGQKIVVIENGVITHYSIEDTNGTLKELGSKPVGDGLTISISDDGKISLANIPDVEKDKEGNDIAATYNAVLVNGKLTWVKPSTTTVEGLSDLITALTGRVDTAEKDIDTLQKTVGTAAKPESSEGAGDAVDASGLFKIISDEEIRAKAAENALDIKIGKSSSGTVEDGDFVAATGLIADIEDIQNTKADISYVDDEIEGLTDAISKLNHFTTKIVTSIDEVIETGILYLIKDESIVGVDKYNEYLYINEEAVLIGDTTTDLSDYYTKNQVDVVIDIETTAREALENRVKTLEDVDNATQAELNSYKEEVTTSLNEKANKATTLSGYGIADAYTIDQIDDLLEGISAGSSESAASVNTKLEQYKTSNDNRVETIETKLATVEENSEKNIIEAIQVNGVDLEIDAMNRSVNITPKNLGVYTISEVDDKITPISDVANEAKATAETNASNITTLQESVEVIDGAVNKNTEDIASLVVKVAVENGKVGTLETIVAGKADSSTLITLSEKVDTNEENIVDLSSRIEINETAITNINETLGNKIDSVDVYTKTEINNITGIIAEGKTLVQMIEEAQAIATYDDTQIKADINTNAINIQNNTGAIAILNSDDKTIGSVDYKIAQEVAKILNDNDSSDIDTLNEIAAWITSDTTGAAKMNADIVSNTAAITKLNGDVNTSGSVLAMIAENIPKIATIEIAGIVKASTAENGISVSEDGSMSVNSINVNKLVQTEGETLVINGGSANTANTDI